MFGFGKPKPESILSPEWQGLAEVLSDRPITSAQEAFSRFEALEGLAKMGHVASPAMPAILRTLRVRISVDCHLLIRVAAAEAALRVGNRCDIALPFLVWALQDEQWGAARRAVQLLGDLEWQIPAQIGALPELIRLAERRLDAGPFF